MNISSAVATCPCQYCKYRQHKNGTGRVPVATITIVNLHFHREVKGIDSREEYISEGLNC